MSTKLKKSQAKIEYLACRDTAKSLKEAGWDCKMIWDELTKKHRIGMAYRTLCVFLSADFGKGKAKKDIASAQHDVSHHSRPARVRESKPALAGVRAGGRKKEPGAIVRPSEIDPKTVF
jgi:hypothetical protein